MFQTILLIYMTVGLILQIYGVHLWRSWLKGERDKKDKSD